jgi:hypothetical protein
MTVFNRRFAELLRWAYANDWRPLSPVRRREGVYTWSNEVEDPGDRQAPTLWVTVRTGGGFGSVRVEQILMPHGRVTIGEFTVGYGQGALDVLAGMSVIPTEYSTAHLDVARRARQADRVVLRANRLADDVGGARRERDEARAEADRLREALREIAANAGDRLTTFDAVDNALARAVEVARRAVSSR